MAGIRQDGQVGVGNTLSQGDRIFRRNQAIFLTRHNQGRRRNIGETRIGIVPLNRCHLADHAVLGRRMPAGELVEFEQGVHMLLYEPRRYRNFGHG